MDRLDEIKQCKDIVDWILNNDFSQLNIENQLYIVKTLTRPRPNLYTLKSTEGRHNRSFNVAWYEKCEWLTGSINREKLFCWTCVLFSQQTEYTNWSKTGFSDLKNLPRSIERHYKTKDHIASTCKIKLFGKQNNATVLDDTRKEALIIFNNQVRANRANLKKLIDVTIFSSCRELPFQGLDGTNDLVDRGNYEELLALVGKYDAHLNTFLGSNIFSCSSKTIQNELIESISFILKKQIDEEIHNTPFFSWEIDETTDISCNSQLSIVFRYAKNGEVVERFLGFHDVFAGRTSENLFELLVNECGQYDFQNKLIAQTYDGAAVGAGHLNELQRKIKKLAPHALFTHCHAHALNLVLSRGCNSIEDCRVFFSALSGFASFFSKSTKRTYVLNEICGRKLPTIAPTCWNFNSELVFTVHSNKEKLTEVFDFIINSDEFKNDFQSIQESVGLKNSLKDSKFCFLLEIFKVIFEKTEDIFPIPQNELTNINYSKRRLDEFVTILENYRDNDQYFEKIYGLVTNFEPLHKKRKCHLDLPSLEKSYKRIFIEIIDTIISQIKVRFLDLQKLSVFELLNFEKFPSYSTSFPQSLYDNLITQYPFFDNNQLKTELMVIYRDPQMFDNCKAPCELFKFMYDNDLHCCMPELYKFLSLLVTIPITCAPLERNFSALKRIKNYTCNNMVQNGLSNSLLSIEKELVKKMCVDDGFYEKVIDFFANSKNRSIPLIFKSEN